MLEYGLAPLGDALPNGPHDDATTAERSAEVVGSAAQGGDARYPGSTAISAEGEGVAAGGGAISEDQVKLALRRVKDPELNLNVMDLGLIYGIDVEGTEVRIEMSLTSPGCPSGPEIMGDAERQLQSIPGVGSVEVNLVWSPPWTPERIEPRVRAYMGF